MILLLDTETTGIADAPDECGYYGSNSGGFRGRPGARFNSLGIRVRARRRMFSAVTAWRSVQ